MDTDIVQKEVDTKPEIQLYELETSPSSKPVFFCEYDETYIPEDQRSVIQEERKRILEEKRDGASKISIPMESNGYIGTSVLFDKEGQPQFLLFSEEIDELVRIQKEKKEAEERSSVDHLTELDNRRGWDSALNRLAEGIQRGDVTGFVTFVMFDINFFKEFNERYGHPEGDKTLIRFANMLRRVFRAGDEVSRWGGDEFAAYAVSDDDISELLKTRMLNANVPSINFCAGVYAVDVSEIIAKAQEKVDQEGFGLRTSLIKEKIYEAVTSADNVLTKAKEEATKRTQDGVKPTHIEIGQMINSPVPQ